MRFHDLAPGSKNKSRFKDVVSDLLAPRRDMSNFSTASELEVLGPRFEESIFLFGLFPGAPPESETTFVNQLLILFQ